MSNTRLSLEAFKAKAENVNTNEVLEKIQGGASIECHGASTQLGKTIAEVLDWLWN